MPKRTCIVCGSKRSKGELLRLVSDASGRIQFDHRQRYKGRGAYVCGRPDCLARVKLSQLQKAFRQSLSEAAWSPALAMAKALQSSGAISREKEIQPRTLE